jgi:signal peptidase I
MEPTYHNGQAILVDKAYYRGHPVARGDVLLLRQDGRTLIKRVFALAGDSFHVLVCPDEDGVNRYILDDQEIPRLRRLFRFANAGRRIARVRVPAGSIYVLGDNSSASIDSRDFGTVPLTDVIGHVRDQRTGDQIAQAATLSSFTHAAPPRHPAPFARTAAAARAGEIVRTSAGGL